MPDEPKSIVLRKGGLQPATAKDLHTMALWVLDSGYAPKSMTKASQIVIAMQHGMELGLRPLQALKAIAVVNGIPSVYGDAALALCHKSKLLKTYKQEIIGTKGTDGYGYRVTSQRTDTDLPLVTEFTVADAKQAKLWNKSGTWQTHPERMLMFKARGFNLRDNFGDVLNGLATYEEVMDYPDEAFTKKDIVDPEEQVKMEREAAAEAHRIEMEAVLATTKIDDDTVQDATFTDVPPANINPETGEITDETQMPDAQGQDETPKVDVDNPHVEPSHQAGNAGASQTGDSTTPATDAGGMTHEEKLLATIREIEEAHPDLAAQMRNSKTQIGKIVKEVSKGRARTSLGDFELQVIVAELNKAIKAAE